MRRSPPAALPLLLALALAPIRPASAAAAAAPAPPPAAETGKETQWTLSGEARFRPEWRDNADLDDDADDDRRQGFMRLRLGVRAAFRKDYRVFVQVQDSRVAGEETSTAANQRNLDLHQGYLDMNLGGRPDLVLTLGRQEWAYGDHRLIGNFSWDNVGRSFDGIRLRHARPRFFLDGLLAQVTSRAAPNGATTGSDLYGLYAQWARRPGAELEAYWLGFADSLASAGETGAPGTTRIEALGGRAKDRLGRFDYVVEATIERGELLGDDLSAHAAAAQAGASWGTRAKVRAFGGYDFATGDEDGADGTRQEFFNFFPTNHPHYGYMDYEGWRNIRSPYGGVAVTRGRHFAQAKTHRFALDEARGPWKDAAGNVLGADPAGDSGRSVGTEIDLTYRFSWMEKAALEGGLSRFSPGRFARRRRGADPSLWAYVMVTIGF